MTRPTWIFSATLFNATLVAGLLLGACAPTAQRPGTSPTSAPEAKPAAPAPAAPAPAAPAAPAPAAPAAASPAAAPAAAPAPAAAASPAAAPAGQRGGTLVVAVRESVLTLDPANHRSRVTGAVLRSMFDALVIRRQDGKVVPELAESWKQAAPNAYDFALRKGVLFHNGDEMTAEDVKFSLERIAMDNKMDGQTSPRKSLLPDITEITIPSPNTVRITMKEAVPETILMAGLNNTLIVPKKYVEQVGGKGLAEKPIGTGPFRFVEAKLDQQIVTERFDRYYGGPPEMPPVGPALADRLVWRVSPELSTAVAALKTGEVHIVQSLPVTSTRELKSDPNIQIKGYEGTRTTWLAMNVNLAPLNKVEVRRALNHATNVDAIISRVLEGQAIRMNGSVPPFSQYYDSSIKPYEYDPNKAKQLLQQAGVGSGFQLTIDTIGAFKDIGEVIAQQYREVGIDTSVRIWEAAALRDAALKGERQMVLWDWGNAFRHPVDLLDAVLKSKGRGNYSTYANPEVDKLLDQGSSATDPKVAQEAYSKAQQILWNDAPWVFGWVPNEIEAGRAEVQNWTPGPDGSELLTDTWLQKR